jgi:hypothetical protein
MQPCATNREVVDDEWFSIVAQSVDVPFPCVILLEYSIMRDVHALGGRVVEASCLAPAFIADKHHRRASVLKLG